MSSEMVERIVVAAIVGGMLGFAHRAAVRLRRVRRALGEAAELAETTAAA